MKDIYNCMCNVWFFKIFVHNFVSSYAACLLYICCSLYKVAPTGQICFHNIWHYAVKALTACSYMHKGELSRSHHPQYHLLIVCMGIP